MLSVNAHVQAASGSFTTPSSVTRFTSSDAVTLMTPKKLLSVEDSSESMLIATNLYNSDFLLVSVYDGRRAQILFERDLKKIERTLPLFQGEVPEHSAAVVAYTVQRYHNSSKDPAGTFTINLNLMSVIVLA